MNINLSATLKIRGGGEVDRFGKRAGKGALVQWEKSGTLGVSQDQTLIVWYSSSMQEATGGGDICPTITGEHQNGITDYTAIVLDASLQQATDSTERHMERSVQAVEM